MTTGTSQAAVRREAQTTPVASERALAQRIEGWAGRVPVAILAYFCVQTALRLLLSDNLEIDEAEIAMHAGFALGYGNSHPPLYDWIVIGLHRLFGSWPASVAVAKNALLASTYLLLFWSGRVLFGNRSGAALLALSLLFMPQIVWQSQITLSHSALAAATSAALIAGLVMVLQKPTTPGFTALGIALGAALLSKYNVALLVIGLGAAVFMVPELRRRIVEPRAGLSLLLATLMVAPHAVWALTNVDAATSRLSKLVSLNARWSRFDLPLVGLDGMITFFNAFVASAGVLILLWVIARRIARREPDVAALPEPGTVFGRAAGLALGVGLALCGLGAFLADIHNVHERYLTPLLMLMPFWLGLRYPLAYRPLAVRRFLLTAVGVAMAVTIAWPLPALFGYHRFAYPYDRLARQVSDLEAGDAAILAVRIDDAVNMMLRLPGKRLFDAAFPAELVLVFYESAEDGARLVETAGSCYRAEGSERPLTARFHYFSGGQVRWSLVILRRDATGRADCEAPADDLSETRNEQESQG